MTVKIVKCSVSTMWYNASIGAKYEVASETPSAYLVRTTNSPVPLQWVYKTDCEVL